MVEQQFYRKQTFNSDLVRSTIQDVLTNPRYSKNAARVAEMLANQPTDPKEVLVKHVEFAARFGKLPSMDNYGRHQSIIVYYFLDVIALIVGATILLMYLIAKIVCRVRKSRKSKIE